MQTMDLPISSLISSVYKNMTCKEGTISLYDALYIGELFERIKPKKIVEIGVASGLSSVVLTKAGLNYQKDCSILSLDYSDKFYLDQSKGVGYLADENLSPLERKHLSIVGKQISFDLPNYYSDQESVDFVFIDANHYHPWPTLDFLAVLPMCKKGTVIAFHDLSLYKHKIYFEAIGPKYLFDQFSEQEKEVTSHISENIFAIEINRDYSEYEEQIVSSLYLPWSLRYAIEPSLVLKIETFLQNKWSNSSVLEVFRENLKRFNKQQLNRKAQSFSMINGNEWCNISTDQGILAKLILHTNDIESKKQPKAIIKKIDIVNQQAIAFTCCAVNKHPDNPGAILTIEVLFSNSYKEVQEIVLSPRIEVTRFIQIPDDCFSCDLKLSINNKPNSTHSNYTGVQIEINTETINIEKNQIDNLKQLLEFKDTNLLAEISQIHSMLINGEKKILYTLAKDYFSNEGLIFDAGLYLGTSTMCFAKGLQHNENIDLSKLQRKPIQSFERGICGTHESKTLNASYPELLLTKPGDNFLPLLRRNIRGIGDLVDLYEGDTADCKFMRYSTNQSLKS